MRHEDSQAKVVKRRTRQSFNVNVGQGDAFISYFVQLTSGLYYKKLDIRRYTSAKLYRSVHMWMMWSKYLGVSKPWKRNYRN
jgi:hypothetical protein